MTIRTRLWVSHFISLIVPIIMSFLILGIALLGLVFYIDRGNYIYVEHLNQYGVAQQILTNVTFRELNKDGKLHYAPVLYHLFDPTSTYVKLTCNGIPVEVYGNKSLQNDIPSNSLHSVNKVAYYSDGTHYYSSIKNDIHGKSYTFTLVASNAVGVDDKKLDFFIKITIGGILLSILISIWLVNKFLTLFTMRRILRPLKALTIATNEIGKGNLNIYISHRIDDEFDPIIFRFNMMLDALRNSKRQRQIEEQSRRELIAGISHDLRTPLTAIKAYVEGLIDGVAMNDEKRQKYLNIIQKKAVLLDNMLEQLFLYSKLDLGDSAVKSEPILLHKFIREYVKDNYDDYLRRGLDITVDIKQAAKVKGDSAILCRILQNMFSNSVKYKTSPIGHSRICLSTSEQNAIITVTDDGPGVPKEKLDRLFEVFYRTDEARTSPTEGSGLGLAITYKYIHIMGGTINATNVLPHGLQITITMPLITNEQDL